MAMFKPRMSPGIILMDGPEAALSPQRTLERKGAVQCIMATHAPLLLTFPGATLVSFDSKHLERVRLQDTTHAPITQSMPDGPERYWRHLSA